MTTGWAWRRRPYNWSDDSPGWQALRAGGPARRRWVRYWLSDTLNGLGDLVMHHALRLCPIDVCSAIGGRLGRRTGRGRLAHKSRRARALLARQRPELDDRALDDAIAAMWDGIGRAYAEFAVLHRLVPAGRIRVDGRANLATARAAGGPVLAIGVHLGNWESLGPVLAAEGMAPSVIYQPPRNRYRHAIARASRLRAGLRPLPPGRRSGPAALRLLKQGGCVLMGIDEHVNGRVHGPVPGRPLVPAGNIVTAARLALATGAVVLPMWCERTGGAHFRVRFEPPVALGGAPGRRPQPEELRAAVERLDDVFRPILTDHMEQWFMLHEVTTDDDGG